MARNTCLQCNGRGTAMPYRDMMTRRHAMPDVAPARQPCDRCGGSGTVGSVSKGIAIGLLCSAVLWGALFWIAA